MLKKCICRKLANIFKGQKNTLETHTFLPFFHHICSDKKIYAYQYQNRELII